MGGDRSPTYNHMGHTTVQYSQRFWDRALRRLARFGHKHDLYGWWQRWRNKRDTTRYQALPVFRSFEDISFVATDLECKVWTRDRARVFWDLISPPQRWWTRWLWVNPHVKLPSGDTPELDTTTSAVHESNDCDEAARFTCAAIRLMQQAGKESWRWGDKPALLQIVWRDIDGKKHGHHVAVFQQRLSWGAPLHWCHGGNWGTFVTMAKGDIDEALPGIVEHVINNGTHDSELICAYVCKDPAGLTRWEEVCP